MTTNETNPPPCGAKFRALYRDYFIDLEQSAQGWRVIAIHHRLKGLSLMPPAFHHPDQTTAERYARAVIDAQLSPRWRRRVGELNRPTLANVSFQFDIGRAAQ